MASSMARAAKVPARPWPLMKMELYLGGSLPTRPKQLPCSTAPNAAHSARARSADKHGPPGHEHTPARPRPLTVDEPDGCHGDREEAAFPHLYFNQRRREDEEQQNQNQAACDPHPLRYPETQQQFVIPEREFKETKKNKVFQERHRPLVQHGVE